MSRGEDLYEHVKEFEREWLQNRVLGVVTASASPSLLPQTPLGDAQGQMNERRAAGEKFLATLKEAWEDHQLCMGMITDVLMYMVCLLSLPCAPERS
jgi:cullin 3